MKSRALASIALGAAVILGTAGCSMISPQATTIHYAAAEGVNVPASAGPITARNVFFVIGEGNGNGQTSPHHQGIFKLLDIHVHH